MTVSLKNKSGRLQVFVLAHGTYCAARSECGCELVPGRSGRRVARSLSLANGVTLEGLDDAVLVVPDVRRAVQRGELVAERAPSAPQQPERVPASTVAEPVSLSQSKKKRGNR